MNRYYSQLFSFQSISGYFLSSLMLIFFPELMLPAFLSKVLTFFIVAVLYHVAIYSQESFLFLNTSLPSFKPVFASTSEHRR